MSNKFSKGVPAPAPSPKNGSQPTLPKYDTCHTYQSLSGPRTCRPQDTNHPFILLKNAQTHGTRAWHLARQHTGDVKTIQLFHSLLHNIEDHTLNILSLCEQITINRKDPPPINYIRLKAFYSLPELYNKQKKYSHLSLYQQLLSSSSSWTRTYQNRYSFLKNYNYPSTMNETNETPATANQPKTNPAANLITPNMKNNSDNIAPENLWVNDTGISRLSEVILNQLEIDRRFREDAGDIPRDSEPRYEDPAFQVIPQVSPIQHMRFNLIRRRDTTSDVTTLKLFKSFVNILRDIDTNINILPYENAKHHRSPITNGRQLNEIDDNKMKLYFRSYHKKQHYSLSGYFHVGTSRVADSIFSHPKMLEWLDSY